jgi:hypothetical protein
MTPRTKEREFTELLIKQIEIDLSVDRSVNLSFDLSVDGPLWTQMHPKVLLAKLNFENTLPETVVLPGFQYDCFGNFNDAKLAHPQISIQFEGRPWALKKFLDDNFNDAIIDFKDLGTLVLSKSDINVQPGPYIHWHTLPVWMNYALSPELWGPQGKWTRFHLRLERLFREKNLLLSSSVGHYCLNLEAAKLKEHGLHGSIIDKSYVLVLPWTFPLTGLEKLEKVVRQEF